MIHNLTVLTIPNDLAYLPPVAAYVKAIGAKVGFTDEVLHRIRLAVDEACTHVIETSFDPGEKATLTISCEESDVGLRVIIADRGIPFNPTAVAEYDPAAGLDRELGGLGFFLMKQVMDQVRFVGKGPEGNELHLVKYLEAGNITTYLSEEELQPYDARVEPAPPGRYEFRLMRPLEAEAIEVAKCVYKTYGYTYPGEHIYYPERLVDMNRKGELVSVVAITDTGEVAGHCAIAGGTPQSPIRELAQAAVDPAHRGRGILTRLLSAAIEEARLRSMVGLFGEPVTNHVFSQRASLNLGFRDTALQLAFIPQSVFFKKIGDEALPQRETLLYNFLPLQTRGDPLPVYVPLHHRRMLQQIYDHLGFPRRLVVPAAEELGQAPEQSVLSTDVLSAINVAHIQIATYGRYITAELRIKLNELCRKGVACIHLDLPLVDPRTAHLCAHLETLGFLLAGVIPGPQGQDVLRLQYLNDVPIDFNKILVASEVARQLRDYIKAQTASAAARWEWSGPP